MEPVEAEAIPFRIIKNLFETAPAALTFGIRFFQNLALRKEEREYDFLCLTPERRYQAFLDQNPKLIARLTQADIARHLGITPVALSRIRKRLHT